VNLKSRTGDTGKSNDERVVDTPLMGFVALYPSYARSDHTLDGRIRTFRRCVRNEIYPADWGGEFEEPDGRYGEVE
jgi:hypothetical protein